MPDGSRGGRGDQSLLAIMASWWWPVVLLVQPELLQEVLPEALLSLPEALLSLRRVALPERVLQAQLYLISAAWLNYRLSLAR